MEEDNARDGISFADIFRTIASQKWLALALAVAITVVCAVSLYFGYNKTKKYYTVSFELELAGSEGAEQYIHKFPDGATFNYRNIISGENLESVKQSNTERFSGVNVAKLSENGGISIGRAITQLTETGYETVYTITAKANCFSNGKVARDYITALAATPDRYLAAMEIDYDVYLTTSLNALDYQTEIGDLIKQVNYLAEQYDGLMSLYGDVTVKDGKTLSAYKQRLTAYLEDRKILSNLMSVAENGLYLKSADLKDKYEYDLKQLDVELEKAQNTLDNLLKIDDTSGSSSNATVIKRQSDLVEDLKRERALLADYISKGVTEAPESFLQSVESAHSVVNTYTEEFKTIAAAVYGKSTSVTYTSPEIIRTAGGMGIMKIAFLSVVLGVVAALAVAYIVGVCLKHRRANPTVSAPDQSVTAEAQEDKQVE